MPTKSDAFSSTHLSARSSSLRGEGLNSPCNAWVLNAVRRTTHVAPSGAVRKDYHSGKEGVRPLPVCLHGTSLLETNTGRFQ